jgi:hypothetical protein
VGTGAEIRGIVPSHHPIPDGSGTLPHGLMEDVRPRRQPAVDLADLQLYCTYGR